MRSEVTPFEFRGSQVRVLMIDEAPWFVGHDVCHAIGAIHVGSALRRLDDDEKGVHSVHTLGGKQELTVVSEAGLYHLILTSRTEQCKPFRRWVTHEVLPAVRRTGHYGDAPKAVGHRTDAIVNAGRVFNTIARVARASGIARADSAHLANEAAIRETGIDLFEVGAIEPHIPDVPPGLCLSRDPWYLQLGEWVEDKVEVTGPEALDYLGVAQPHGQFDLTRVGMILKALGFTRKVQRRVGSGREWVRMRPLDSRMPKPLH